MGEEKNNSQLSETEGANYSLANKILSWVFTPIYLIFFISILLIFHPIQIIARMISYNAHMWAFNMLNYFLSLNFRTMGTRMEITFEQEIPQGRPVIFVSNHQSMYDIPFLVWPLRKYHPKFISKIELGRGLPSISYALRHGGSVLIDRSNPRAAIPLIEKFARYIEETKRGAVIFAEGTRGRAGVMRRFKTAGLLSLMKNSPSAIIVPVAIDGSWELLRFNFKPIPWGVKLKLHVFAPITERLEDPSAQIRQIENTIRKHLNQAPIDTSEQREDRAD